jgi:NADH-quinone oxidoreductase subunit H
MAEYGSMLTVSLLASILFLGGWHGPIPITQLFGLQPLESGGGWLAHSAGDMTAYIVCQTLGVLNVLAKGFVGVSVMMWVRWTLPRLRIDQVMTTCLKYCTPISAVMFLCAALWNYALPGRNFFGLTRAPAATYSLDEGWVEPAPGTAAPSEKSASPRPDSTVERDRSAGASDVALAASTERRAN